MAYAGELAALGVKPGSIVPIQLSRSRRFVATLLAVLHCGAAYAGLDPRWSEQRMAATARLVDATAVVGPTVDDTGSGR